jgi:hypothetical protein
MTHRVWYAVLPKTVLSFVARALKIVFLSFLIGNGALLFISKM